ncbi:hypothetical protein M2324_003855 [Rhodovulum sulfidophilum]|uniref:VPLPA-CTERM sorting domain-containing protein n=1 Tax=Rhodovulum sulfidophilum TaxID=35806 RepID=UPI0005A93301|nr:VPLPA-CTERM sorting domain-containing protein [Rhodovulum sulfidophilum]ANB33450.1 hypothetical protein A6W98_04810 [Rhodovulum sulfidophilum DSM 1374]ANB37271.1 hypothetical protein A6024_04660 [Rhodovulum sulfidophilum]MCW2305430.1 hypothetical protein [Rhodovulum sulfidophilum]
MKHKTLGILVVANVWLASVAANAATFAGYTETSDVYFDDDASFDYDPSFLGGSITSPDFLIDVALAADLSSGFLTLLDDFSVVALDGTLVGTALSVDNGVADDSFSMLFSLSTGIQSYAIATFTGDLDGFGISDFFTDGVLFADGNLTITGATQDGTAVVPLPAGAVLLLSSLATIAGFGLPRRRGL